MGLSNKMSARSSLGFIGEGKRWNSSGYFELLGSELVAISEALRSPLATASATQLRLSLLSARSVNTNPTTVHRWQKIIWGGKRAGPHRATRIRAVHLHRLAQCRFLHYPAAIYTIANASPWSTSTVSDESKRPDRLVSTLTFLHL